MRTVALAGLFLILAAPAVWAKGGSEAGNGGGLAEKNIVFAYMNLDRYEDLCLESGLCRLTATERELLNKIRETESSEKASHGANAGQIVFQSEKRHPGSFFIDGQVRVAKTGDSVGDSIYVNTDLLYYPVSGELRAVDIPTSVSILIHELGHHHGVKDHAALDVLGSKLQTLLLTQSQRAEFWNGNAALITFQLNTVRRDEDKKTLHTLDQVILENDWSGGSELVPLTDRIAEATVCPGAKIKVVGLRLYNLHEERGVKFDKKTNVLRKPFRGWYVMSCTQGSESDHGDLKFELGFQKLADGSFRFKPALTRISQISCLKDVRVCK